MELEERHERHEKTPPGGRGRWSIWLSGGRGGRRRKTCSEMLVMDAK